VWERKEVQALLFCEGMMALKTIEQEWTDFSGMIFAKMDPGPTQVKETKQAFFAGAFAMLCAAKAIGEPEVSEDEGVQYLEDRQQEATAFYKDMMKRYAEGN
jgi:hypothetical protein